MWKKIALLTIFICSSYSVMAGSYAKELKQKIETIENRSDIDPDSFAIDIKTLENELALLDSGKKKLSSEQCATYKSILHGVLATAYSNMLYSNINAFDAETQKKYTDLSKAHFSRVLEDMPTLSRQNSKDYEPLIERKYGSKYFGHNMLAVMLDFVLDNRRFQDRKEQDSLRSAARKVFQLNGDRNSDTMLRLRELEWPNWGSDKEKSNYCKQLEALLDSTKDIRAGELVKNRLDIAHEQLKGSDVGIEIGIPAQVNFFLSDASAKGAGIAVNGAAIGGAIAAIYWLLMMVGRAASTAISGKVSTRTQMITVSSVAILFILIAIFIPKTTTVNMPGYSTADGFAMFQVPLSCLFLVLCGLCTSVMWGAIFNLAVEGLGKYTEQASGIFMMLVVGGGIMPLIQEFIAKSNVGYMNSYWLVIAMLCYLLYYAVVGCKNVNKDIPVD